MANDSDAKSERNISIGGDAIGSTIITGDHAQIIQPAPFTPSALHQLPPPSADFVGRKKEIRELLKASKKGGVIITGLGGVGKTEMALQLAHILKPQYPDAQFVIDLKGASKEPLSSAEAMTRIIRFMHPSAQLPEDENDLRGFYLSLLDGKKVLLLIDNAGSREQIIPLNPPADCLMLITSRNRFTLSGFVQKKLDTLTPTDARQLLKNIAPRIGKNAGKIAQLCGYLPLALELAAKALQKFINLTPNEYLSNLTDAKNRLELVEASLSVSYSLLTEDMQKRWRVLSVFPDSFNDAAVAFLWQMNVDEAKLKLAELITCSLIEWNKATWRYRLHDLVRLFADSHLSETDRHTARKEQARCFMYLLNATNQLYLKGADSLTQGVKLFDLERENIEEGHTWSVLFADRDSDARIWSLYYVLVGSWMLSLRLSPIHLQNWMLAALKSARTLKLKLYEGTVLNILGLAYHNLKNTSEAIICLEQALVIARETGDHNGEGHALGNLGLAYSALGEWNKAIEFFAQAIKIAIGNGNRRGEGIEYNNMGTAYNSLGELDNANELFEKALVIAREIGAKKSEADTLGNLGNVNSQLGKIEQAIVFYEEQLAISQKIGFLKGEVHASHNLGHSFEKLGKYVEAKEFYQIFLKVQQKRGDRRGEREAFGHLGSTYDLLGEPQKAIENYKQRLTIDQEFNDPKSEGHTLWHIAIVYHKVGDQAQAVAFAEMAISIYEQLEPASASEICSILEGWKSEQAQ